MNIVRQKWYSISIRAKVVVLAGIVLISLWALVALVMLRLHTFSSQSAIIMNEYMDITGFMDAFSAENVCLEVYVREIQPPEARENYLASIQETDRLLRGLQPSWQTDQQSEYALKRAIHNAMEHYRASQHSLLAVKETDGMILPYLSLRSQAAYIDGYSRDLLHGRMVQGGSQWRDITASNARSEQHFVLLMAATTVLTLLVLLVFTRSILKPLADLGRAAGEISKGRYDAPPLAVHGGDEIGRTAQSFNLMQTEIRRTIHALEREAEMEKSLREKEAEAAQMQRRLQERRFAQLQSQINPHFLFNTLNTIAALAQEESAPLSEELILRLSRFFRYSLESDEKLVSLGREIQLLRDYMELQETRYGDRITMEIQADPALNELVVPKFILQPLVENAILHGLRTRSGGGQIRVRTYKGRLGLTVMVTDNGCGFRPGSSDPALGKKRSVGLDNIRERMELSGGRLDVFSRPGLGTAVRIILGEGAGALGQDFGSGGRTQEPPGAGQQAAEHLGRERVD